MNKLYCFLGGSVLMAIAAHAAEDITLFRMDQKAPPTEFTFMEIHAIDQGGTVNEKFFLGRLPLEGEAVEMIYVGEGSNGALRFQLRVRQ